ncbi:hypothetical protein B296_00023816 [Ensete ventricosum]|uniref:Uncharacterized protein n=1 Tax=Ensete ventricosum TaxID=4639 RepID=A0A427AVW2_ENSVE|nr:hypothetical protein B296_00023816 [Ensete ventricosum]
MEVWRIENFAVVPIPKSFHGKFFTGDSYVILKVLLVFVGEQKSLSVGLSSNADILANVIGCVMSLQYRLIPLGTLGMYRLCALCLIALLKRQGLNVEGLTKSDTSKEEPQPYIDCTGDLQVLSRFSPCFS